MTLTKIFLFFLFIRLCQTRIYPCSSSTSCGCSSKMISTPRIVGGRLTEIKTWPWTVSVNVEGVEMCGGTILSSEWILTAAHCTANHNVSNIIVHAGSSFRWAGVQQRNLSKVIVHTEFQEDNYMNDIALMKLSVPLDISAPNVAPICLPTVDEKSMNIEDWPAKKTPVVAVGWGRIFDNGPWSDQLREVKLKIIDNKSPSCEGLVANQQYQLCAGVEDGGKDTCAGDSGGPLMMLTTSNQWILVGITSFGFACALPGFPGVYTRVAYYHDWIRSNTNGTFSNLMKNSLIMKKSSGFLVSNGIHFQHTCFYLFSSLFLFMHHQISPQFS